MNDTPARFEFTGTAREYFRIWIVNVFLTIVTLGIYSAWAKVRKERYFHGNTILDGHRFDFVADPVRILRGRLLAVLALVTYTAIWQLQPQFGLYAFTALVLALPALIVLSVGFRLHNTTHRNIRFGLRRDVFGLYRAIGVPVLVALVVAWVGDTLLADWKTTLAAESAGQPAAISFGPLFFMLALLPLIPYLDFARSRYLAANARFGSRALGFDAGAGDFYGVYLLTALIWFVATVGFVLLAGLLAAQAATLLKGMGVDNQTVAITAMVIAYMAWFFVWGFFTARRRNLLNGALRVGDAKVVSRLRGRVIGWLYLSNTIAIILSVGLLIPWATIRTARYVASRTELDAAGLESVASARGTERSAVGEEIGDAFGYDLGF